MPSFVLRSGKEFAQVKVLLEDGTQCRLRLREDELLEETGDG